MEALVHNAGPMRDGVQECSRCGYQLHRGRAHELRSLGFAEGAEVAVLEDGAGHRVSWLAHGQMPMRARDVALRSCEA
jgi:Fe2+ transport system protein FeoA